MPAVKSTQRFDLSPEDVKTAIREYIEKRFGPGSPVVVRIDLQVVTTGYGMNEHDSSVVSVSVSRES